MRISAAGRVDRDEGVRLDLDAEAVEGDPDVLARLALRVGAVSLARTAPKRCAQAASAR